MNSEISKIGEAKDLTKDDQLASRAHAECPQLLDARFYVDAVLLKLGRAMSSLDNRLMAFDEEDRTVFGDFLARVRNQFLNELEALQVSEFEFKDVTATSDSPNRKIEVFTRLLNGEGVVAKLEPALEGLQEFEHALKKLAVLRGRAEHHAEIFRGTKEMGDQLVSKMNLIYADYGRLINRTLEDRFGLKDDADDLDRELESMKTIFESIEGHEDKEKEFLNMVQELQRLNERRLEARKRMQERERRRIKSEVRFKEYKEGIVDYAKGYPEFPMPALEIEGMENVEKNETTLSASGLRAVFGRVRVERMEMFDADMAAKLDQEKEQESKLQESSVRKNRLAIAAALAAVLATGGAAYKMWGPSSEMKELASVPAQEKKVDSTELDLAKGRVREYLLRQFAAQGSLDEVRIKRVHALMNAVSKEELLRGATQFIGIMGTRVDLKSIELLVGVSTFSNVLCGKVYGKGGSAILNFKGVSPGAVKFEPDVARIPLSQFCQPEVSVELILEASQNHGVIRIPATDDELRNHCKKAASIVAREMKAGGRVGVESGQTIALKHPDLFLPPVAEGKAELQGFFQVMQKEGVIKDKVKLGDLSKMKTREDLEKELFRVMGSAALVTEDELGTVMFHPSDEILSGVQVIHGPLAKVGIANPGHIEEGKELPLMSGIGKGRDRFCQQAIEVGVTVVPNPKDKKKGRFYPVDITSLKHRECEEKK